MTLAELQQKRARLATEMRTYHDAQGDADWGDEQRSKWAAMRADIKKLDDQIEREQELRDQEQRHVEDNADDIAGRAAAAGGELSEDEQRAQAFGAFLSGGMASLTSEQRALARQDEQRAQAAGVNDKGGYTVPPSFIAQVHELMAAYGGIASVARVLVTDKGNAIEWPTSDGATEEGELVGENTETGEADVTFGMDSLGAHKVSSKIIRVSNELLTDTAVNMEQFLAGRVASRIGRTEARLIVQGTGAGTPRQPKGLAASADIGKVTASATAFTWKEVNGLIHSIDPAYRMAPKFRLAFNDATLQLLEEMEDGQGRPLWLPGVANGPPATILNRQYVIDQAIADIGAGNKFMFAGDFDQFVIRRVRYMVLRRLTERYAEFDQTAFLAFHRFGCVLQDMSAIRALQGKPAGGG
ncbi:phage major capsid protein [Paracandidimonas soli]|uniref:HK97 family phage major capsid protein n=1 Tax=Paracandidimonas soli TaxID=1917182 RepID=A0A4R3USR7_9BURK|nr:phage major capsid protein [Paracandidimonas soli]TCU93941.1 HK97 family phage major capsid protein [Paracandidimonas soli]